MRMTDFSEYEISDSLVVVPQKNISFYNYESVLPVLNLSHKNISLFKNRCLAKGISSEPNNNSEIPHLMHHLSQNIQQFENLLEKYKDCFA